MEPCRVDPGMGMTVGELPRSRTLPLLRSPAPYRHVALLLALAAATAALLANAPALLDRARLAEAMIAATVLRVDPSVEYALNGRWPDAPALHWHAAPSGEGTKVEAQHVTPGGIALTVPRGSDRVRLELDYEVAHAGALRWRCRVHAAEGSAPIEPVSVPAVCRA